MKIQHNLLCYCKVSHLFWHSVIDKRKPKALKTQNKLFLYSLQATSLKQARHKTIHSLIDRGLSLNNFNQFKVAPILSYDPI